jgi:hypothetical protein
MKSHMDARNAAAFSRCARFVLPVILAFSGVASRAQQYSVVGQWHGVFQGITFTISIQSNGQYSQLAKSATAQTTQAGPYSLVAPNTIIFAVSTWAPTVTSVYVPTSPTKGRWEQRKLSKPPNSADSYVFKGPNTMIFTDQMTHGSLTLTRVAQ